MRAFQERKMSKQKKQIPIEDGLWANPQVEGAAAQLIGSKCLSCGEIYFPKRKKSICIHCQQTKLTEIALSGRGKIASFSVIERAPAGGFYNGPVPYAYGDVNLDDGVVIRSLFTGDFDELKIGAAVEMVFEKLYEDGCGDEIITYKFRMI